MDADYSLASGYLFIVRGWNPDGVLWIFWAGRLRAGNKLQTMEGPTATGHLRPLQASEFVRNGKKWTWNS